MLYGIDISNNNKGLKLIDTNLRLATMRDDDRVAIKVDNIEVVWNAE